MKNRTGKALVGLAGAVVSAAAVREGIARAFDRKIVCEALDRQEPKAMEKLKSKIKGTAEDPEFMELLEAGEQRLRSIPHETLRISAHDGTALAGHLFRSEKPDRLLIAMHGWRSSWARDFAMAANFFRENGCSVLYAEQRGQGSSGGDYMSFGMLERYDCLSWVNFLNEQGFRETPIYLVGISMGATTVLMAAGFDELPPNVLGVIADCGFTSAKEIWKHVSRENLGFPIGRREKQLDALCRKRIDMGSDAYSTLDAMHSCKTPVLFIHGSEDSFVPVEMTLQNYDACAAPKRLLLVEGANHGMSYLVARQRYEAAVKDFWITQEKVAKHQAL